MTPPLFPTIIGAHWRHAIAQGRSCGNAVREQIAREVVRRHGAGARPCATGQAQSGATVSNRLETRP